MLLTEREILFLLLFPQHFLHLFPIVVPSLLLCDLREKGVNKQMTASEKAEV